MDTYMYTDTATDSKYYSDERQRERERGRARERERERETERENTLSDRFVCFLLLLCSDCMCRCRSLKIL